MKTIYYKLLFLMMLLPFAAFSQNTVEGIVLDSKTSKPIAGVNVVIKGGSSVSTQDNGAFKLVKVNKGDKITFSYIGYQNQVIEYTGQKALTVMLAETSNTLEAVTVQVGYGSVKKKDVTGSVAVVTSKDFNKGAIMSADQLLVGKTPGVRITTTGGAPDSDPNIRIRGGASISGENRPLIVIDGVPIDNQNAAGNGNPLSLINPNDIESFSVLKDASSTAIYGARASNGVIIITTKRGTSGKPQFNFSSTAIFGTVSKYLNVMDGAEYTNFINTYFPTSANLLGYYTADSPSARINDPAGYTDWQKVIYRTSQSFDTNFSARANLFKVLPSRFSVGYNNMQGLVKNNDYERYTGSVKLNPTLFNKSLKIDLNAKGIISHKNDIDAGGAIGSAVSMDPTKPIYGYSPDNRFQGYYQDYLLNSNQYKVNGAMNPLALIEQVKKPVDIKKVIGNVELDYKFPFFPDLKAVVNLGLEASSSKQQTMFADNAMATYSFVGTADPNYANPNANYFFNSGESYFEYQTITNKTADAYLMYSKKLNGFVTKFDTQLGHTFQSFLNNGVKRTYTTNTSTNIRELDNDPNTLISNRYYQKLTMESYFSRTNFDLKDKFLFTFTLRADASSFFPKDRRWGYFPAVGFAWKMKQEKFLENSKTINDLKLRLGYGITGNSDLRGVAGYYPYSAFFGYGSSVGQYFPGVNSYTAIPFNPSLTWETTTTYNAGLDFDLFKKGIVTGSIDVYYRKTKDLLEKVAQPPGQMLTNNFVSNIGSTNSKGVEFSTNVKLIDNKDVTLTMNANIAYNISKIEDLKGSDNLGASQSGLPVSTGSTLAYYKVGEQVYSAWVFEQVYDVQGKPIPNAYVDRNKDGVINDNDRYYVALRPNWTYGFGYNLSIGKLDITASFRGQMGGKVYNAVMLNKGNINNAMPTSATSLTNVLNVDFPFYTSNENVKYSDYYLENASFLRCESLFISYKFKGFTKNSTLRVSTGVNNLFLLTKYKGQDPENFNAIDNNFYPRPLMTNFGLNYEF